MTAALDQARLEAAVAARSGDALTGIRSAALARFLGQGLPGPRHEDWRYTNLGNVVDLSNRWLDSGAPRAEADSISTAPEAIDAVWIPVVNGVVDRDRLAQAADALGSDVTVTLLSEASGNPELLIDDALASLNAALMPDALRIQVSANSTVNKPIGLLIDDTGKDDAVTQLRLIVDVGANASAEFVELHRSESGGARFCNSVTEARIDDGARVAWAKIQERAEGDTQIGRLQVTLGRDSRFEHAAIDLGGRLIRNDTTATIAHPGAHFGTAGLYLTGDNQHVDNHVTADHQVGPATSTQNYRGIAGGTSRCVFNGKAMVREGADGTDAEQSNHNLLLSKRAEIDTKPELEIYAEDVKCSHGATVGQLDDTALFYLRSRGLDRDQAARVLTRAFAGSVIEQVPVAAVADYLSTAIDQKLDRIIEDNRDD